MKQANLNRNKRQALISKSSQQVFHRVLVGILTVTIAIHMASGVLWG